MMGYLAKKIGAKNSRCGMKTALKGATLVLETISVMARGLVSVKAARYKTAAYPA